MGKLKSRGVELSEEAKLAYLKEKINEARRKERTSTIIMFVGVIIAVLFYSEYPFHSNLPLTIMGIVLVIMGIVESTYYELQKNNSMKQLEKMAFKTPACPKCGKAIPKGNFAFCPFCGASLSQKS